MIGFLLYVHTYTYILFAPQTPKETNKTCLLLDLLD
jgi:hypothetical protein